MSVVIVGESTEPNPAPTAPPLESSDVTRLAELVGNLSARVETAEREAREAKSAAEWAQSEARDARAAVDRPAPEPEREEEEHESEEEEEGEGETLLAALPPVQEVTTPAPVSTAPRPWLLALLLGK